MKTERDDPDKCQNSNCSNKALEGAKHCEQHRNYLRAGPYQVNSHLDIQKFTDDKDFKSTRTEVAMLKGLLELLLNNCNSKVDLIINETKISNLVERIQKLVINLHKMEVATGQVLDKPTLALLMDGIVAVIAEEIKDEDTIRRISAKLGKVLEDVSQKAVDNLSAG